MEAEIMTREEVLAETIKILSNINIPAGLAQQVGIPICHAINNIRLVIDAGKQPEPTGNDPEGNPEETEEKTE